MREYGQRVKDASLALIGCVPPLFYQAAQLSAPKATMCAHKRAGGAWFFFFARWRSSFTRLLRRLSPPLATLNTHNDRRTHKTPLLVKS